MKVFISEKQIKEIRDDARFEALRDVLSIVENEIQKNDVIECWNYTAKRVESKVKFLLEESLLKIPYVEADTSELVI